jgi:hypothetical protein
MVARHAQLAKQSSHAEENAAGVVAGHKNGRRATAFGFKKYAKALSRPVRIGWPQLAGQRHCRLGQFGGGADGDYGLIVGRPGGHDLPANSRSARYFIHE